MAKRNKRDNLKRQLAQAHNAYERANYCLGTVHLEFDGHKSGLDEYLVEMIKATVELQEHILKFWEIAWGKKPTDLNKYR